MASIRLALVDTRPIHFDGYGDGVRDDASLSTKLGPGRGHFLGLMG